MKELTAAMTETIIADAVDAANSAVDQGLFAHLAINCTAELEDFVDAMEPWGVDVDGVTELGQDAMELWVQTWRDATYDAGVDYFELG